MSILKAAGTVSAFTMMSRIVGFVRDIAVASMLGAGMLMDTFVVASRLPNFFRSIFAEGAFNAAFVPLYSGMMTSEGKEKM